MKCRTSYAVLSNWRTEINTSPDAPLPVALPPTGRVVNPRWWRADSGGALGIRCGSLSERTRYLAESFLRVHGLRLLKGAALHLGLDLDHVGQGRGLVLDCTFQRRR